MGPVKKTGTGIDAYAALDGISTEDKWKLYSAGGKADDEKAGLQTMEVKNPSADTLAQLALKKNPVKDGAVGAAPDLTDDLVRQARQWSLLNQKAKRGQGSTFLTNPQWDFSTPQTTKKPGGI